MAKRRTKKLKERQKKASERAKRMDNPSGESNYGRKHAYCFRHGLWGFDVRAPKPWKRAD